MLKTCVDCEKPLKVNTQLEAKTRQVLLLQVDNLKLQRENRELRVHLAKLKRRFRQIDSALPKSVIDMRIWKKEHQSQEENSIGTVGEC